MNLEASTSGQGGTVSGVLRYYAPTKGRCEAYRAAFKAMAMAMQGQGISMRDNKLYDFKCTPRDSSLYEENLNNCASFDGVTELALNGAAPNGVFQVHNESVLPIQVGADFSDGFGIYGSAGNEWVVNQDNSGLVGNEKYAETEFEEIPFTLTYDPTNPNASPTNFQWRPDPALYLAVMTGTFELYLDTIDLDGSDLLIKVNVMIAGWKSIMGDPDKKRRRSRRSRGNGSSKKTTTTVTTVKK